MKNRLVFLVPLLALAISAPAQMSPGTQVAQLQKLSWSLGTWQGGGWMLATNGARTELEATFEIQRKLGGLALGVDHTVLLGGGDPEKQPIIDGSVNLVFWDEKSGSFHLRSHRIDGRFIESPVTVEARSFQFSQPSAIRQEVRFTCRLDGQGRLIWSGDESRDGKEWKPFLEFTLQHRSKP